MYDPYFLFTANQASVLILTEVSVSGSTSKYDYSIQQTLSLLVTQISSLASRMDGIEKSKKKDPKQSKGSSTSTSKKTKLAKKSRDEGSNESPLLVSKPEDVKKFTGQQKSQDEGSNKSPLLVSRTFPGKKSVAAEKMPAGASSSTSTVTSVVHREKLSHGSSKDSTRVSGKATTSWIMASRSTLQQNTLLDSREFSLSEGEHISEDDMSQVSPGIGHKRGRSPSPDGNSDGDETRLMKLDLDPSYVDMIMAIKGLLKVEVPEVLTSGPPTILGDDQTKKKSSIQSRAFPIIDKVDDTWTFLENRAFGGKRMFTLQRGQFLNFQRPLMEWYITSPKSFATSSPKLSDAFKNVTKAFQPPSVYNIPAKFHHLLETVSRENVQVLTHIFWWKKALQEISSKLQSLVRDLKSCEDGDTLHEALDLMDNYHQLYQRIMKYLDTALDSLIKCAITSSCNLLLNRRDNLFSMCHSDLPSDDLRNASLKNSEVFPAHVIQKAERPLH